MTVSSVNNNSSASSNSNLPTSINDLNDSNFQNFLKLLTTQLKNQDPTNPADTNNLTQEIASLSQVEQQIATNKNLTDLNTLLTNSQTTNSQATATTNSTLQQLLSLFSSNQYNNMAGNIGKEIDATGNSISLQGGAGLLAYNLPANTSSATITITNSAGKTVYSGSGPTAAGRNEVTWGALSNDGTQAPDGIYHFSVTAKDAAGNALSATTYTTGIVTSADTSGGTTNLSIGPNLSVPFSSVISIRQPSVPSNSNSSNNSSNS